MDGLNRTHGVNRCSFVATANEPGTDFPLQNLPLGIFRRSHERRRRVGVAVGDQVLDLAAGCEADVFAGLPDTLVAALSAPSLNPLMELGNAACSLLRARVADLLDAAGPEADRMGPLADKLLVPIAEAALDLPVRIGNFTDFLTSGHHSLRMSGAGALAANFVNMPIAYHGRASSVDVGGVVVRPNVQSRDGGEVRFGPTRQLDFELELGAFIGGPGNRLGVPQALDEAARRLFGYCLLNDWSARDVQGWESVPLGPFLAKNLWTSISPWVVTEEALRPFRTQAFARSAAEPALLPYLTSGRDQAQGGLDLTLEAFLLTAGMRAAGFQPARVTCTNFRLVHWTFAQMATHHMSNGCNLLPGDLIGSGTTSGPADESRACLAELTDRGRAPIVLPGGEMRTWLEDGNEVIIRGRAEREGFAPIGFGECRAAIAAAPNWPEARGSRELA